MKKITKRIMALILSFAMILGCIPSFINEASALGDKATLEEILNTVEGGFPNTIEDAWESENGKQVIYEGGKLKFLPNNIEFDGTIEGTLMGSAYSFNNNSFFCNIENNKLISIFSYDQDYGGTYEPVPITIADVLETVDFPTSAAESAPIDAWVSEGKKLFIYDDLLYVNTGSRTTSLIPLGTNVSATEGGYCYTSSHITYKFVMTDDNLTSIIISPVEGGQPISYGGTYEPVPITIADVLATVLGGFPTTSENGWKSNNGFSARLVGASLSFYNNSSTKNNGNTTPLTKNADGNYENTEKQLTFVMTNGILTSIIYELDGFAGTYEPTVKTISVNYEQPKTVEELENLSKLTVNANATSISNFTKQETEGFPLYIMANNDPDFLGYFVILIPITFEDDIHFNAVDRVYLRDIDLGKPTNTLNDILPIASTIDYAVVKEANTILVIEKFDFSKSATITCPITAGTTIEEMKQSITSSFETTASTDTANIYDIRIETSDETQLSNTDTLENNKEYIVQIVIDDVEVPLYTSIKVNNTTLTYYELDITDPELTNNHFTLLSNSSVCLFYKFDTKQSSGGSSSKTYKAKDTNDTAEKVSGSGKKGSTRTITPIEGKKVSSVIVTDKNGNKVDVTINADGTYSFVQPASDVTIEVNYKNREITLNIGSTEASVDGEKSNLDVCPVTRNDRTMLPIRFVAENLGAKVEWNEKKPDYVAITRGDTKIEITLGSDVMLVNGKEVKLDSVAFAENDRTYLPVRAISEALNAIVEWNEERPMEVKIYER